MNKRGVIEFFVERLPVYDPTWSDTASAAWFVLFGRLLRRVVADKGRSETRPKRRPYNHTAMWAIRWRNRKR